jgi:hypothetical protein
MHQHRARRRTVRRAHEALGPVQTIVVRHQRQPTDIARLCPGRIAAEDQARERHQGVPRRGRRGGGVVPFYRPEGQLGAGEGHEVLSYLGRARRARDAGDEDRREQGARVDVEVVAPRRDGA